ncbi:MAG TPA: leucyl aminopeptidase, partial [Candidatus Desulfofervidus auxilii]|nr:leucyl aminopeptidase [Candidatus Desulfofervidus auxilii]
MEFSLVGKDVLRLKGDVLVVGVYKKQHLTPIAEVVNKAMSSLLKDFLKDIHFEAEAGEAVFMPGHKEVKFKNIVVVGLGEKEKLNPDTIRKAANVGLKKAKELKNKDVYFEVLGEEILGEKSAQFLTEGIILGDYRFKKYKKPNKEEIEIEQVQVLAEKEYKEYIQIGKILAEATNFTREIVNEPGNVVKPMDLANISQKLAQEHGLVCEIYDKNRLEKEGMNGIVAVGQGSEHPPCFIHLVYKGERPQKKVVLIGKGITFDSGGLDLKPEKFMKTMKCDKSGACAVLGIIKAVAELKLNLEIHGLIPTAENMPGGNAFRPDDIIVFKNGKSVEIGNTDAEGRLILADALIYGSNLKPEVMVDMATLTGACMVALGRYTTGIFCSNERLVS